MLDEYFGVVKAAYGLEADDIDGVMEDLDAYIAEEIETEHKSKLVALWDARKTLTGIAEAAKILRTELERQMQEALGPVGVVRLDDYLVRVTRDRSVRCVDPEGLRDFLGDKVMDAFNPNQVRKTILKTIATEKDLDPNYPLEVFFEEKEGRTEKLSTIPLDRAPKFAESMSHGEARDAVDDE